MHRTGRIGRALAALLALCLSLCCAAGCTQERESKLNLTFVTPEGVRLTPGEDAADLTERLGEPLAYREAASCYGSGKDKVYTYGTFTVTTYPETDGSREFISLIELTDAACQTAAGAKIGMLLTDVEKLYGDDPIARGDTYSYVSEEGSLVFYVEDGRVSAIDYRFA